MNTLVLYIPYDGGALLISDRQSTKSDGTIEPWDKIYHLSNYNAVIGFSGTSEASRSIAQNLGASANHDFFDQYRKAYRELDKMDLTYKEKEIESLCIIKKESSFRAYKFTRDLPNSIYSYNPIGIGSGELIIRNKLVGLDTSIFDLEIAMALGLELISDAAMWDSKVGSPYAHGIRLATVSSDKEIQITTKTPAELPFTSEHPPPFGFESLIEDVVTTTPALGNARARLVLSIPNEAREALGIKAYQKLHVKIDDKGRLIYEPI